MAIEGQNMAPSEVTAFQDQAKREGGSVDSSGYPNIVLEACNTNNFDIMNTNQNNFNVTTNSAKGQAPI